jgi:hypothetical protein
MATNQVAAEAIGQTQGRFQVHPSPLAGQDAKGGAVEGFWAHISLETIGNNPPHR